MKEDAKGFVFLPSFAEQVEKINSDTVQLALYRAIVRYGCYGEIPDFSNIDKLGVLDAVFYSMQRLIDWTKEQRNRKAETARANGAKSGGNPNFRQGMPNPYYSQRDNQDITNDNQDISIKEKSKKIKDESKKTSRESRESREKSGNRFSIPTLEEIKSYIEEKGFSKVDAGTFFDYYESNGWMVGRNKMKNWKASISRWERTERDKAPAQEDKKAARRCEAEFSATCARDYKTTF